MELPRLNLSLFTRGSDTERLQFAADLLSSLSAHGFVKLVNHGFADEDLSNLWEMVRSSEPLPALLLIDPRLLNGSIEQGLLPVTH